MYYHLFIFVFGIKSKKSSPRAMSRSLLPMFSYRSFMVSGLTFKSLIHFELIFVYSISQWSSVILLHMAVQLSQHNLLQRLSCPHCIFLSLLPQIDRICLGVFLGSLFCSIDLCVCFYANTILF